MLIEPVALLEKVRGSGFFCALNPKGFTDKITDSIVINPQNLQRLDH